jgi:glutaredoxin
MKKIPSVKKFLIAIIIGIILLAAAFFLFFKKGDSVGGSIVYYYGQSCPHCQNVENFLKENKIEEKIAFEKKEVYYNQKNAQELAQRAKKCGWEKEEIPVPFLWDGSQCIIGDEGVINFFKEKIKK